METNYLFWSYLAHAPLKLSLGTEKQAWDKLTYNPLIVLLGGRRHFFTKGLHQHYVSLLLPDVSLLFNTAREFFCTTKQDNFHPG